MDLGRIIAQNLYILRTERNLSLGSLAKLSGISKTMLSDIEKGNSNPTINTIWKIANGLKVPYTKLIDNTEKETIVLRKADALMQTDESENYRVFCYYQATPVRNFELFYVELDAMSANNSIGHSEKSQEYIYVISGQLNLLLENVEYVLNTGDSFAFDSSLKHTYKNETNKILTFMVVNFYPN